MIITLILFALVVIVLSYLKKMRALHIINSDFLTSAATDHQCCGKNGFPVSDDNEEETVVAIMAGDMKPSFVAKPMPLHRENQMTVMV